MNKKTVKTIWIVITIFILGFAIYFLFLRNRSQPTVSQQQGPSFGQGENPSNTGVTSINNPANVQTPSNGEGTSTVPLPILRQISVVPIAGAIAYDVSSTTGKKTQIETIIRYMESANGHVEQAQTDNLTTQEISVTTIPKLNDAVWNGNGTAAYIQYIDDSTENIQTYYGQLKAVKMQLPAAGTSATGTATTTAQPLVSFSTYEIQGAYLPPNISAVIPSKTASVLYYLQENNAGSQVISAKPDGTAAKILLDSPLKEWILAPVNATTLSLTTKASASVLGYLYFLNTTTGRFDKIIGNTLGLTALANPDDQHVLYGSAANGGIALGLYNIKTGVTGTFPATTLPEKCIWSQKNVAIIYCAVPKTIASADYPDAWYQGLVSFNDEFWEINAQTGTSTLLADPQSLSNTQIDGVNLFLDPRENYLYFTNKKDGTLWSVSLNQ